MFDSNTTLGSTTMQAFRFAEYPSHDTVSSTVTALASAWFFVAAAFVIATPTDTQVARHASVQVNDGPVMPAPEALPAVAQADVHFRILVEARRA
jgi:hypothetical protein